MPGAMQPVSFPSGSDPSLEYSACLPLCVASQLYYFFPQATTVVHLGRMDSLLLAQAGAGRVGRSVIGTVVVPNDQLLMLAAEM